MSRVSPGRKAVALLALVAAFVAGAGWHHLWPRDAHAQTVVSLSTIYVPPGGLMFRGFDGKAIARLSRDGRGAVFELYDDQQESAARFVPDAAGRAAAPRPTREPYVLDDDDPFAARH